MQNAKEEKKFLSVRILDANNGHRGDDIFGVKTRPIRRQSRYKLFCFVTNLIFEGFAYLYHTFNTFPNAHHCHFGF